MKHLLKTIILPTLILVAFGFGAVIPKVYAACASDHTYVANIGCVANTKVQAVIQNTVIPGGKGVDIQANNGAVTNISQSTAGAPLVSKPVSGPTTSAPAAPVASPVPLVSGATCDGTSTNGCAGQAPGYVFAIGTDCMTCSGSAGGHCGRTGPVVCPGGSYTGVPAITPTGGLVTADLPTVAGLKNLSGSGTCDASSGDCSGQAYGQATIVDATRGISTVCNHVGGTSCSRTYANNGMAVIVTDGNCAQGSASGCVGQAPGTVFTDGGVTLKCVKGGGNVCSRVTTTDVAAAASVNTQIVLTQGGLVGLDDPTLKKLEAKPVAGDGTKCGADKTTTPTGLMCGPNGLLIDPKNPADVAKVLVIGDTCTYTSDCSSGLTCVTRPDNVKRCDQLSSQNSTAADLKSPFIAANGNSCPPNSTGSYQGSTFVCQLSAATQAKDPGCERDNPNYYWDGIGCHLRPGVPTPTVPNGAFFDGYILQDITDSSKPVSSSQACPAGQYNSGFACVTIPSDTVSTGTGKACTVGDASSCPQGTTCTFLGGKNAWSCETTSALTSADLSSHTHLGDNCNGIQKCDYGLMCQDSGKGPTCVPDLTIIVVRQKGDTCDTDQNICDIGFNCESGHCVVAPTPLPLVVNPGGVGKKLDQADTSSCSNGFDPNTHTCKPAPPVSPPQQTAQQFNDLFEMGMSPQLKLPDNILAQNAANVTTAQTAIVQGFLNLRAEAISQFDPNADKNIAKYGFSYYYNDAVKYTAMGLAGNNGGNPVAIFDTYAHTCATKGASGDCTVAAAVAISPFAAIGAAPIAIAGAPLIEAGISSYSITSISAPLGVSPVSFSAAIDAANASAELAANYVVPRLTVFIAGTVGAENAPVLVRAGIKALSGGINLIPEAVETGSLIAGQASTIQTAQKVGVLPYLVQPVQSAINTASCFDTGTILSDPTCLARNLSDGNKKNDNPLSSSFAIK